MLAEGEMALEALQALDLDHLIGACARHILDGRKYTHRDQVRPSGGAFGTEMMMSRERASNEFYRREMLEVPKNNRRISHRLRSPLSSRLLD